MHAGKAFPAVALSMWLLWPIACGLHAGESGRTASHFNIQSGAKKDHPLENEELICANSQLERAVGRALTGLQGEPLKIFVSNQAEWEQILADESGVIAKPGAPVNASPKESEGVDLKHGVMLIKRRVSWIHGLMDHFKSGGDGLTGFWSDNRGGWMSLVDKNGVIYFSASCIRGRDHYHGHVRGHAVKNGKRAIFKDTPMDEEVKILFTKKGPWLRVEGTNTDVYHGLQAYFDGDYVKIAPLTPAKQKLVISSSKEPLP